MKVEPEIGPWRWYYIDHSSKAEKKWYLHTQEHYKLFDVGEVLEEAVRIRSLEDWHTRGEAAADDRSMAPEREPSKYFQSDILRGRQSEGYDCSWGVP